MENTRNRKRQSYNFTDDVKRDLRALTKKLDDDWHGTLALLADVGLIYICVVISLYVPMLYIPAIIVIGCRMRALATIVHEVAHYTFCSTRWLAEIYGMVAAWLVFQNLRRYRRSHVHSHHPMLGNEKNDPDILNYHRQGLFDTPADCFVRNHFVPLLLGLKIPQNLRNLLVDRLLPQKGASTAELMEHGGLVVFWVAIALAVWWMGWTVILVKFWLVPYIATFQMVNWLIELSEHFPLTRLSNLDVEMTRNRHGGIIENFFVGIHGEGWHLIHHLYPGIPFWRLAKAHGILMRDETYRRVSSLNGGLFVRGPNGEPPIISVIRKQLAAVQRKGQ